MVKYKVFLQFLEKMKREGIIDLVYPKNETNE
jgi:hypothetical protein